MTHGSVFSMKQLIINILVALVLIAGGVVVIIDKAQAWFGISQYLFNFLYFVIALPAGISAVGAVRTLHPECYEIEP